MLQFSRYNISIKVKNKYLIFNSISGAIISVSRKLYLLLKDYTPENSSEIPENYQRILSDNKILANDESELNTILKNRESINNDDSTLSIMIHPTLYCNIKCPYCYQKSYPKSEMTFFTADNIILFISTYVKKHPLKHLLLTWSGGEPLLAMDKIEYILHKIKSILPPQTTLLMNMISNGILLSDRIIQRLDEVGIHSLQITVDGLHEEHNKRRSIDDYDSFSEVIKNIKNILLNYPSIYVNIRVNVDKSNINDYVTVYDFFGNHYKGKNYSIYPECVIYDETIGNKTKESIAIGMTKREKVNFFIHLITSKRLNIDHLLSPPEQFCIMKTRNSFAVGADGKIYNCELMVGSDKGACDNINNYQQLLDYITFRKKIVGLKKRCTTCSLLPICNYGCIFDKRKKDQSAHCHLIKGNEKEFITLYATQIILGKEEA